MSAIMSRRQVVALAMQFERNEPIELSADTILALIQSHEELRDLLARLHRGLSVRAEVEAALSVRGN